jgi:hypothetical protein
VGSFTSSSMIISLESICVERPGSTAVLSLTLHVNSTPDGGWRILPNFDLAYANEIMEASYAVQDGVFDYQAVRVTMFTRHAKWSDTRPNQELPYVGEIRVDLGPEYSGVEFANSKGITEDGLHVFEFADLVFLEGREQTTVLSMMLSEGKDISIRTDPPRVDRIELSRYQDGQEVLLQNPLTLSVGDKIWFSALGRDSDHRSVNIAPKWEISPEGIVSLLYAQGDQNELRALNAGETVIKGYLPASFGADPVFLNVIVEP